MIHTHQKKSFELYTVRKKIKCSGDAEILYYMEKFVILHEVPTSYFSDFHVVS